MTTIIATRAQMGADSFVTDGSRVGKVYHAPGMLLGGCGDTYYSIQLVRWVLDGMRGPPPPPDDDEARDSTVLILRRDGLMMLNWRGVEIPQLDDFFAIGSGASFALGAMKQGAAVMQALEIAAWYDENTKGPFDIVDLRQPRQGPRQPRRSGPASAVHP